MTENKNKGGGEQNLTVSLIEYIEPFIFEMKKKIELSLNYLTPTLSIALTFYLSLVFSTPEQWHAISIPVFNFKTDV